jgi:hypothetical protein
MVSAGAPSSAETYLVGPGSAETIYGNMPLFGLAAATTHVPVSRVGHGASDRLSNGAGPLDASHPRPGTSAAPYRPDVVPASPE